MVDIDLFKKVNDTYGHDAGDEVLRVLAKVAMAAGGKLDIFARWGGEEFVAVLPEQDTDQARAAAESLRMTFERQDFTHTWSTRQIPFTVSIGVATRAPGERDFETVLKRADQALYAAKGNGRNRVEVARVSGP
jgi:diguanylate cyclase (GGDEF)-like protein